MFKLIDISYWQKSIDFQKVKADGYNYAILRAGYRTTKDEKFDEYAIACKKAEIKIGVYFFSYATNIDEVKKEAQLCTKIIKPYDIDLPVFYDFEYDTVKKAAEKGIILGKKECCNFTVVFCEEIKRLGYTPGYYCNTDYYNNMYTDDVRNKGYAFWLSHYKNDYQYHTPPYLCDFFQYTSEGIVNGINGTVDTDVCFNEKYLNCKYINPEKPNKGDDKNMATKQDAINRVLEIAEGEIGYLEKVSNSQLDNKTANAGQNNYTKYWRDVKSDYQGQPWCACFVTWCFDKAFGKENTKVLLKHYPYVYCPTLGSLFTKYANPEVGDIVIFYRNGTFTHTGIVTKVSGDQFWTIEGNTSGGSTIIANGGAVCAKQYYNSNLPGTKFCRVDWEYAAKHMSDASSTHSTPTPTPNSYNKTAKWAGIVVANSLNVRTLPGVENPTCSFSPLIKGTKIEVCDETSNSWYYIKYENKYGFVSSEYIQKNDIIMPNKPISYSSPNNLKFPDLYAENKPSGTAIGVLQSILHIPVTNTWNNELESKVKTFKASVGLPTTNVNVGIKTWTKLIEKMSSDVKNN